MFIISIKAFLFALIVMFYVFWMHHAINTPNPLDIYGSCPFCPYDQNT
jgi:hypothetical protein